MERDPSASRVRRRIVVHGRVQGVWFRDSTARQARALGVAGWVRNRGDGTVEAAFEGDPRAVDHAIAYCRQGPPRARVERVDVADEPVEGLRDFEIRY